MNKEEIMSVEMLEKIEIQKPTHEEIAIAAYYIWLSEGCPEGCAERHWYEAEAQLIRMRQAEALERMKNQARQETCDKSEKCTAAVTPAASETTCPQTSPEQTETASLPKKAATKKKKSASSKKSTKK